MIPARYLNRLKDQVNQRLTQGGVRAFIFGSNLKRETFHDIDVAIEGATEKTIRDMKDYFEESTFPYKVDIINLNTVSPTFKNTVLKDNILWIKP